MFRRKQRIPRNPKGLRRPTNRIVFAILLYRYWMKTSDG